LAKTAFIAHGFQLNAISILALGLDATPVQNNPKPLALAGKQTKNAYFT